MAGRGSDDNLGGQPRRHSLHAYRSCLQRERELLSEIATLRVDLAFEKDRTSNQEEVRRRA